jgi:hypothetical protein
LIPPDASAYPPPTVDIVKRILRGIVKVIAVAAVAVFIFDNTATDVAGIVLLIGGAVLVLCLFVWRIVDLGDDDWFSAKRTG